MADSSYNAGVYLEQGGNALVLKPGEGRVKLGDSVVLSVNAAGRVLISGLPTADPGVAGALWNNSGVLTVSAG
jgi:hypothetical protein